jgi:hypothetical protein
LVSLIANGSSTTNISVALMIGLSISCYGIAAVALNRFSISQVKVLADRPRRQPSGSKVE